jgi:hypothetical protein
MMPKPICFMLLWQLERRAFSRARAKTGNKMAARIAIMAITTSNSMSVKPQRRVFLGMGSPVSQSNNIVLMQQVKYFLNFPPSIQQKALEVW